MTDAATTWKLLRLKVDPTADDLDWAGTITTPNRLTFLVGGTTTAGVYSLRLVGKVYMRTGAQHDVDFTATITRAAETDAQIASNLSGDFLTGTVTTASPVLLSDVGITASVDTATVTVLFPPGANITVTTTAPAPGAITSALGLVVPITASAPHYGRAGESSMNGVVVMVNAMDDAGATLLAPGTGTQTTFDMQAVEICEVETVNSRGDRTYSTRYGRTTTLAGCTLGNEYQLPLRGAKYWTVRITNDADPVSNTDSYEVIYRDAAT